MSFDTGWIDRLVAGDTKWVIPIPNPEDHMLLELARADGHDAVIQFYEGTDDNSCNIHTSLQMTCERNRVYTKYSTTKVQGVNTSGNIYNYVQASETGTSAYCHATFNQKKNPIWPKKFDGFIELIGMSNISSIVIIPIGSHNCATDLGKNGPWSYPTNTGTPWSGYRLRSMDASKGRKTLGSNRVEEWSGNLHGKLPNGKEWEERDESQINYAVITHPTPRATLTTGDGMEVTLNYFDFPTDTTALITWGDNSGTLVDDDGAPFGGEEIEIKNANGSVKHTYADDVGSPAEGEDGQPDDSIAELLPWDGIVKVKPEGGTEIVVDRVFSVAINSTPVHPDTTKASLYTKKSSPPATPNRQIIARDGQSIYFRAKKSVSANSNTYETTTFSGGDDTITGVTTSGDYIYGQATVKDTSGEDGGITPQPIYVFYRLQGANQPTDWGYESNHAFNPTTGSRLTLDGVRELAEFKDTNLTDGTKTTFSAMRDFYRTHVGDPDSTLADTGDRVALSSFHGAQILQANIAQWAESYSSYYNNADGSLAAYVDGGAPTYTVRLKGSQAKNHVAGGDKNYDVSIISTDPRVLFKGLGGTYSTSNRHRTHTNIGAGGVRYFLHITSHGSLNDWHNQVRIQFQSGNLTETNYKGRMWAMGDDQDPTDHTWSGDRWKSWSDFILVLWPFTNVTGSAKQSGSKSDELQYGGTTSEGQK